ncbi:MAG TPA: hypothetical protein DGR97_01015 [Gammaproteobacteria bacterium]|nr:hypothetical protein [Gammaproteobacteria bacterium]|tara:strand:- start:548 stop:919 length:372 start_codon:yes stop_codon:yes gene_type:complete
MKLDFDQTPNTLSVTTYSKEGITLGGRLLTEPFVVKGIDILLDIVPESVGAIGPGHIELLVQLNPSLIIIGTGSTQIFIDAFVLKPALETNIGVEVMNTAAACRSFNVLVAENRAVVGVFYTL